MLQITIQHLEKEIARHKEDINDIKVDYPVMCQNHREWPYKAISDRQERVDSYSQALKILKELSDEAESVANNECNENKCHCGAVKVNGPGRYKCRRCGDEWAVK